MTHLFSVLGRGVVLLYSLGKEVSPSGPAVRFRLLSFTGSDVLLLLIKGSLRAVV